MPSLANVYRGGHIESIHTGSIVVVDSSGRLLAFAGDPGTVICLRSAAKPFQAIPLIEYGGVSEYDLSGEDIALMCGSHGGEPFHVATAAALLRKGEFDESDLLCGAHFPYDEKTANDLRAAGDEPSPLHNNCSGKHAGMLLATEVMDAPSAAYVSAGHPLQVLCRHTLSEFCGVAPEEIPIAVDGCGVPAYFMTLHRAAWAYARLMATAGGMENIGALSRYEESASHVVEAMTGSPEYVAGRWSITTPLMESFGGAMVAKEGAEGFYAMGLSASLGSELTERLRVDDHSTVGIALKINDGSMGRGRNPAILRTLELLGIDLASRPQLAPLREWPVTTVNGTQVGEVRSEFELEIL